MRFAPKPENDFVQYIEAYYNECRSRFDGIEAIAGKWMFRDLIPAMSDFDTRFVVRDDMSVNDWCRMSTMVGEAHYSMCSRYPCWARNLEHLPGVNLTWEELEGERTYYPEYKQWTFYHTENPARLTAAIERLRVRPWDVKDEYYHLKKFCLYYGRYDRTIDPAVNLGVHANKYPLHSRIMHYFCPPVMSAVCILERANLAGKFDALEIAQTYFPDISCWDPVNEILHAGYETPGYYEEPLLTQLEDVLEEALRVMAARLRDEITILPNSLGVDVSSWKSALSSIPIDPAVVIFENAKFCRLMKGRLQFYANPPRYFDSTWPLQNELGRIGNNFFKMPFRVFWKIRTGQEVPNPADIVPELRGDILSDEEVEAVLEFNRLTGSGWESGNERQTALGIVKVFDAFFNALSKISAAAGSVSSPQGVTL